jgi:peptidoglycan/LPS O-acetylase OafA/YrhL
VRYALLFIGAVGMSAGLGGLPEQAEKRNDPRLRKLGHALAIVSAGVLTLDALLFWSQSSGAGQERIITWTVIVGFWGGLITLMNVGAKDRAWRWKAGLAAVVLVASFGAALCLQHLWS